MSDSDPVLFTRAAKRRTENAVLAYEHRGRSAIGKAYHRTEGFDEDGRGPGGSGVGGCCCLETKCPVIEGVDGPIVPIYLELNLPNFRCNCEPDGAEAGGDLSSIRLYRYPSDDESIEIWRTIADNMTCAATIGTLADCTTTAHWVWSLNEDSCDPGSCCYECVELTPGDPEGGYGWTFCDESEDNCRHCGTCDVPVTPPCGPAQLGFTETYDCVDSEPSPSWVFVSVDDEDCECTPVPPDYEPDWDGMGDPPTAETECHGTKLVTVDGEQLPAIWELKKYTGTDYYGCDKTTLQFIVGVSVYYTYQLTRRCGGRGFCYQCVNSFSIQTCGPSKCAVPPPGTICVTPRLSGSQICNPCGEDPMAIVLTNYHGKWQTELGTTIVLLPVPEDMTYPIDGSASEGCAWVRYLPEICDECYIYATTDELTWAVQERDETGAQTASGITGANCVAFEFKWPGDTLETPFITGTPRTITE